jgi:hypothetical protein
MPIFHEQAFRAGAGAGKDLSWLRPEHFGDWRGLAVALDRLCPEQRCDATSPDSFPLRGHLNPPTASP